MASQQLPGLVTGSVVTSSTLISTLTSLTFKVKPSLPMSAKAYIQIIIPPSLSFEEKLCTIS